MPLHWCRYANGEYTASRMCLGETEWTLQGKLTFIHLPLESLHFPYGSLWSCVNYFAGTGPKNRTKGWYKRRSNHIKTPPNTITTTHIPLLISSFHLPCPPSLLLFFPCFILPTTHQLTTNSPTLMEAFSSTDHGQPWCAHQPKWYSAIILHLLSDENEFHHQWGTSIGLCFPFSLFTVELTHFKIHFKFFCPTLAKTNQLIELKR